MGSNQYFKTKRNAGKVDAPLNEKLQKVEWGEFKLGDLFEFNTYKKRFDANKVEILTAGKFPYVVRMGSNNGQRGFINEDEIYLNEGNTISFGQDTATMFYQEKPYFTGDKIKILKSKDERFSKKNAQFFILSMSKTFSSFSWGGSSFNVKILANQKIQLPTKNGKIDFEFMESFITKLETERINKLETYLIATGLNNYILTEKEKEVLQIFRNNENLRGGVVDNQLFTDLAWRQFNLENLFGKSTRGRRLKSDDRIVGTLPFVTAGETDEGVSAFIGNDVIVFPENTTTIDMFGSAKFRNYKYGGDDHIAVVHTQNLPKLASIFVTTAIHKTSYNGQFNYGRNFYAKDADVLNIQLPTKDKKPNYELMETLISAIQKLVIKDVVLYTDSKISEKALF